MRQYFHVLVFFVTITISCKQAPNQDIVISVLPDSSTVNNTVDSTHLQELNYLSGGNRFKTFYASPADDKILHPIVLVIPEWWGLNDYIRYRVKKLAAAGYIAMGVDMYTEGFNTSDPKVASEKAGVFYKDVQPAIQHFSAALAQAKKIPGADSSKVAVIGYCFGGAMSLQMAYAGEPVNAVVSFHGNLPGQAPEQSKLTMPILVLNGAADSFISSADIDHFKTALGKIDAKYQFINYPGAKHAFTNPNADKIAATYKLDIAYNPAADTASWTEMLKFLKQNLK